MKKRRISILRITLLLLIVVAAAAFVYYAVIPSQKAWAYAQTISDEMRKARSVSIVEFERGWIGRELVFKRLPASPERMASLRVAIGAWVAPIPKWEMMCFDPHHRVEIVRPDGSELRFEICFHCQNFQLGSRRCITLPNSWVSPLRRFFTDAGMAPREDYSELATKHPEYPLLQKEIREFEEQLTVPAEKFK